MAPKTGKSASKADQGALGAVLSVALIATSVLHGLRRPGPSAAPGRVIAAEPQPVRHNVVRRQVLALDRFQRSHRPLAFGYGVVKKFGDDRAGHLAALISYFGFFSLFPLLLALASILGLVFADNPEFRANVQDSALKNIPLIGEQISVGELRGSIWGVVIGLVGAIWAGLRVVDAAQNAMNEVWDQPITARPGFLRRRLRGVVILILFAVALFGSTGAAALASILPDIAGIGRIAIDAANLVVNFVLFLVLFQVLVDRRVPWKDLVPGAAIGALAWVLLNRFGTVYMQKTVEDAGPTYGSFATVIGLLTWLFVSSQLIILAAEINVVRARRLWPRSLSRKDLTDADHRAYAGYAAAQQRVAGQRISSEIPDV